MAGKSSNLIGLAREEVGGLDENRIWELAQSVERTAANQKHILRLLDQLESRVRVMEKQDDHQEERLAQMQETMASLVESVQRVEVASTRLKYITFGLMGILGVLAALTGILGGDVVSKIVKAGATLM